MEPSESLEEVLASDRIFRIDDCSIGAMLIARQEPTKVSAWRPLTQAPKEPVRILIRYPGQDCFEARRFQDLDVWVGDFGTIDTRDEEIADFEFLLLPEELELRKDIQLAIAFAFGQVVAYLILAQAQRALKDDYIADGWHMGVIEHLSVMGARLRGD